MYIVLSLNWVSSFFGASVRVKQDSAKVLDLSLAVEASLYSSPSKKKVFVMVRFITASHSSNCLALTIESSSF